MADKTEKLLTDILIAIKNIDIRLNLPSRRFKNALNMWVTDTTGYVGNPPEDQENIICRMLDAIWKSWILNYIENNDITITKENHCLRALASFSDRYNYHHELVMIATFEDDQGHSYSYLSDLKLKITRLGQNVSDKTEKTYKFMGTLSRV